MKSLQRMHHLQICISLNLQEHVKEYSYEIKEMREFYEIYRNDTLSKRGGAKADPATEQLGHSLTKIHID